MWVNVTGLGGGIEGGADDPSGLVPGSAGDLRAAVLAALNQIKLVIVEGAVYKL
jgi:hypothetical protein